jgi:hypothetical protein
MQHRLRSNEHSHLFSLNQQMKTYPRENIEGLGDELTPLMECVLCSNFTAAAELIKAGANVN